jgi:ribA/ribD-fused uncharacterized protein
MLQRQAIWGKTMAYAGDGAPLSVAALIARMDEGWTPAFLMFWGHRAKAEAAVGKHVFSQWWPAPFKVDGVRYPTAEHFMMAQKARLFGDEAMLERIRRAATPLEAKKLGRKVKDFRQEAWEENRFAFVVQGNVAKFGQNAALRSYLLGTGDKVLVEASPMDRVWGIGMAAGDPRAGNPPQWQGSNLLGFALMASRVELAQGREDSMLKKGQHPADSLNGRRGRASSRP